MGSGWVPWVVALLVNLIGLDSSMTQGRDSPGKNREIFFQVCMQELAWGRDAFPYRFKLQTRLEVASGFRGSDLPLTEKYFFPSLLLTMDCWEKGLSGPQNQGIGRQEEGKHFVLFRVLIVSMSVRRIA